MINLSGARTMRLGLNDDARLRFILRHGMLPWGIAAGLCAALGGAVAARRDAPPPPAAPVSHTTVCIIAAICFVIWSCVGAWIVGAIRWQLRGSNSR